MRAIHGHVIGSLPDGTPYRANDEDLLLWVHATETLCFLDAWRRYGQPGMSLTDQDRYFAEVAFVGRGLGADSVPTSRAETLRLIDSMRGQLCSDERTREVRRIILDQPASDFMTASIQRLLREAAIDLLPRWARRLHGVQSNPLIRPVVRSGTLGVAQALRWAFH